MATFYFNGAADVAAELPVDWQTLGNWWMSYNAETDTHSVPATSLPTSADSIEMRRSLSNNSGSEPTVVNAAFVGGASNFINITITGLCTFNDSALNTGTINGDCTFNTGSTTIGTITGNCTFNDSANSGTITGLCNFNDNSDNGGTITGLCTFNDTSANSGTITGDCNFNDNSENGGTITGNCNFNDSSRNGTSGGVGTITGDCNFNDSSYNRAVITGDCTFNDTSTNYYSPADTGGVILVIGTVNGNCTFSLSSAALHIDQALFNVNIGGSYSDRITGTIDFQYEKGINGSSILGIV